MKEFVTRYTEEQEKASRATGEVGPLHEPVIFLLTDLLKANLVRENYFNPTHPIWPIFCIKLNCSWHCKPSYVFCFNISTTHRSVVLTKTLWAGMVKIGLIGPYHKNR